MWKKFICVFLSITMMISFCTVTVLAKENDVDLANEVGNTFTNEVTDKEESESLIGSLAESLLQSVQPYFMNVVLTTDNTDEAVDISSKIMAELTDKIVNSSQYGSSQIPNISAESAEYEEQTATTEGKELLVKDLQGSIQSNIFVKAEDVDAATMKILESSEFTYELVTDTQGTVYISVDIENNPEIFDLAVFRNVVDALYAAQGEELLKNNSGETDYAMSYEHIAGELALHAILYAITSEMIEVTGTKNEVIVKLYNQAAIADLNYNESRISPEFISFIGVLVVNILQFNLYRVMGIL